MENKQIAKEILITMLENGILLFERTTYKDDLEKQKTVNERNTQTICNAYKKILDTVKPA